MPNAEIGLHEMTRFRGRSYLAFVLTPEPPIFDWLANLDKWVSHAADYFIRKPVALDLSAVKLSNAGIVQLINELRLRKIRVLGLEGIEHAELGPNLPPVLSNGRETMDIEPPEAKPLEVSEPAPKGAVSLLLDRPVRSGQSVVFEEGDITVLGSVASGAEIAASGSIHIYGALRGRAHAGISGNSKARIFCNKVEAELLAINGVIRTFDDIDANLRGQPIQAWLRNEVMFIAPLG